VNEWSALFLAQLSFLENKEVGLMKLCGDLPKIESGNEETRIWIQA
jgi:hypothetical protein